MPTRSSSSAGLKILPPPNRRGAFTRLRSGRFFAMFLVGGCLWAPSARALNPNWNGPANGNWFTALNWNTNTVPTSSDTVFISQTGPLVNAAGAVSANVSIGGNNASAVPYLTVQGSGTLDVGTTLSVAISAASSSVFNYGSASILSGARVTAAQVSVGLNTKDVGTLLVDGAGSQLNITKNAASGFTLIAGDYGGTATVTVSNGATLTAADDIYISRQAGTGTLTVASGGTLNVNGNGLVNLGYGGIGGNTTLNIGSGGAAGILHATAINTFTSAGGQSRVNFNHTDASYSFGVSIYGIASLNQIGSGTTILTSNGNTYSGGTTVSAGRLLVDNTSSSSRGTGSGAVTVNGSGSTLGGTGFINAGSNTVSIGSGSVLLGGNGSTASGALTLTGNLTMSSNSIIELALGPAGAHSSLARAGSGTWSFATGQAFTLLDFGAQTGSYSQIITGINFNPGDVSSWTITNDGYSGQFSWDGNNINLNLTMVPVPEPGTWAAGLLAAAALGYSQRRRLRGGL